jgi:hypothetical protein
VSCAAGVLAMQQLLLERWSGLRIWRMSIAQELAVGALQGGGLLAG